MSIPRPAPPRHASLPTHRLGAYHLEQRLGAGAMGTVFLATHDHALLESLPARTLVLRRGVIDYDGMWPP